jgi:anti-anti-sigma factor
MRDNDDRFPTLPIGTSTKEFDLLETFGTRTPATLTAQAVLTPVGAWSLHAAVSLGGELCAVSTPALAASVDGLLDGGVVDLCFDLGRLDLCTSAGVDLWTDVAHRVRSDGGDVRLLNAHGGVRRVLDVVGIPDSGVV